MNVSKISFTRKGWVIFVEATGWYAFMLWIFKHMMCVYFVYAIFGWISAARI